MRYETNDAYLYYENKSPGLGDRFLTAVEATYKKLSHHPQYYSFINTNKDVRDIKIKDFPFVIIFQIVGDQVFVLSVFNTNPDPQNL